MNIQGKEAAENPDTKDRAPIAPLTESEIWELAEHLRFARLGTNDEGTIHITPVNMVMRDKKFYFRTAPGSKLTQLILDEKVTV